MRNITLDLAKMKTQAEAHKYLGKVLEFPDYYGENLDALYDCLGDIGTPTIVTVPKKLGEKDGLGGYGVRMLKVFRLAAEQNSFLQVVIK